MTKEQSTHELPQDVRDRLLAFGHLPTLTFLIEQNQYGLLYKQRYRETTGYKEWKKKYSENIFLFTQNVPNRVVAAIQKANDIDPYSFMYGYQVFVDHRFSLNATFLVENGSLPVRPKLEEKMQAWRKDVEQVAIGLPFQYLDSYMLHIICRINGNMPAFTHFFRVEQLLEKRNDLWIE
jgi:hypothetical protein